MELQRSCMTSDEESILLQQLNHIAEQHSILGVFGYGSYFNGTSRLTSDIDVLVLSKSAAYERIRIPAKRELDIWHIGYKRLLSMLAKGHECYVPALTTAHILYDEHQLCNAVQILAQRTHDSGHPDWDDPALQQKLLSKLHTIIDDLKCETDWPQYTLLWGQLCFVLYRLLCTSQRQWGTSENKLMSHLQQMNPILYKALIALLNERHLAKDSRGSKPIDAFCKILYTDFPLQSSLKDSILPW